MVPSAPDHAVTLGFVKVDGWAPLAWVAVAPVALRHATVFHGRGVETFPHWCGEAVWDGPFEAGDLDRTDIIAGSGLRVRGSEICFVSSGDSLNRLHWQNIKSTLVVSNSLPALLALTGAALLDDFDYAGALGSMSNGFDADPAAIPSSHGPIHVAYHRNLVLREGRISETDKPSSSPAFETFAIYRDFLLSASRRMGANARAASRRHAVGQRISISSGYDSGAAAVIARAAGATEALTIPRARRDASNLFSLDDSGAGVAAQLGLRCTSVDPGRTEYPFEDAAWASLGNVGDLHFSVFSYPTPACLLFTGFRGDSLWSANDTMQRDRDERSPAGTRFSELRLELGVIICSPVYWGWSRAAEIRRLSKHPEMKPWTVGGDYDRPLPRRLLEDAGVKRGTFATRKRVASFNRRFAAPLSTSLRDDFTGYLREQHLLPGTRTAEKLRLLRNAVEWALRGLRRGRPRSTSRPDGLPAPSTFLRWAVRRCARRYRLGLDAVSGNPVAAAFGEPHPRS